MTALPTDKRIWEVFSELLEYPRQSPVDLVIECQALTESMSSAATEKLRIFQEFLESASLGQMQEEYTRAFDMDESHCLYVGYHLLGESYKRSALLLEFMQRYKAYGLDVAGELADHLPVVLRFLAVCDDEDLVNEFVGEAIWPMLEIMTKKAKGSDDALDEDLEQPPVITLAYHDLLSALLLVVRVSPLGEAEPLAVAVAIGRPTI